jgi:GAF domain-containing protein
MIDDTRRQLIDNIRIAVLNKTDETELLTEAIKLIDTFSDGFDWTGFYLLKDGFLEVGPYVGPETPHEKIELDKGICGASVSQKISIIVDDVNSDPRFLACSVNTKSEIVVPLVDGDEVLGEIDIDSNQPSFFTNEDREMFEEIAEIIVNRLKEVRLNV